MRLLSDVLQRGTKTLLNVRGIVWQLEMVLETTMQGIWYDEIYDTHGTWLMAPGL